MAGSGKASQGSDTGVILKGTFVPGSIGGKGIQTERTASAKAPRWETAKSWDLKVLGTYQEMGWRGYTGPINNGGNWIGVVSLTKTLKVEG